MLAATQLIPIALLAHPPQLLKTCRSRPTCPPPPMILYKRPAQTITPPPPPPPSLAPLR